MSELLRYVNISIGCCSILVCLIAIAVLLFGTKINKTTRNYFLALFMCLAAALCSNITGLLTKGQTDEIGRVLVRSANFAEFFFSFLLSFLFTLYILHVVQNISPRCKRFWYTVAITYIAAAELLVIVTQFTGLLYTINENSIYQRGSLYWISSVMVLLSLVIDSIIVLSNRKNFRTRELVSFVIYLSMMFAASIATTLFYGIYWMLIASTLAAIIMTIYIARDQVELYYQKEKENAEMQSAIMLSQIQPHFLYNALMAIARLCDLDPGQAKKTTLDFSEYLRGNLDSLSQKRPVLFSTELRHTQIYADIEKIRFGDKLHVEYDIQTEDFLIPSLTVQPLMENAVKYGVGKKKDGGTVWLRTRENTAGWQVIVSDDGVGFDPDETQDDGRSHIGIDNVRRRLMIQTGGRLRIQSVPGVGTTAEIWLPKGGKR